MLVKQVLSRFDGRAILRTEDFGNSPIAERYGLKQYPAVFIDDTLVATPRDFYDWGSGKAGRYTPWREQAGRDRFIADFRRMISLRLEGGALEPRTLTAEDAGIQIDSLPEVQFTALDGSAIDTATMKGEAVLVQFWASWCPPCLPTLNWLPKLAQEHAELNVLALAVQSDEEQVRGATRDRGDAWTVAVVETETADAFGGVMAVPTLLLFDRSGKPVEVFYGAGEDLAQRVSEAVARL